MGLVRCETQAPTGWADDPTDRHTRNSEEGTSGWGLAGHHETVNRLQGVERFCVALEMVCYFSIKLRSISLCILQSTCLPLLSSASPPGPRWRWGSWALFLPLVLQDRGVILCKSWLQLETAVRKPNSPPEEHAKVWASTPDPGRSSTTCQPSSSPPRFSTQPSKRDFLWKKPRLPPQC